jgi:hypothetical protein
MLRKLNDNAMRIEIVTFFKNAMELHLNPASETKSEPPIDSGEED